MNKIAKCKNLSPSKFNVKAQMVGRKILPEENAEYAY